MRKNTKTIIDAALASDDTVTEDERQSVQDTLHRRRFSVCESLPLLLTQAQAAKLLSCSRSTIYRLMRRGVLHPIILGDSLKRYTIEEIQSLAAQNRKDLPN